MRLTERDFGKMESNGTKQYVNISDDILSALCKAYNLASQQKQNSGQAKNYFETIIIKRMNELMGQDGLYDASPFCFHTIIDNNYNGIKCKDCGGYVIN